MVCGYHASQAELAPNGYLTGAEWNWEKVYPELVTKIKKGEKSDNYIRGGLKAGIVKMSPYGPKVSDEAKKDGRRRQGEVHEGRLRHLQGAAEGQRRARRSSPPAPSTSRTTRSWKR